MSEPAITARRVLVIASPTVAAELEAALSRTGIEVRTVTPDQRVTLTEFSPPDLIWPDLIWLWHDPPALDGLGILEQLRAASAGASTPVVVFARAWDAVNLFRAGGAHASSCLQWPTENRDAWLLEVARYWTSINEPAT